MPIRLDLTELPEPQLEFGGPGVFTDPKVGLKVAGPFDLRFGAAHPESIRIGLVGAADAVERARRWLERCRAPIVAGMDNRSQYPDYPGFEAVFHCKLQLDDRWVITLGELDNALADDNRKRQFERVLDLYANAIEQLANLEVTKPDVVMCCLTDEVTDKCWSISADLTDQERAAARALRQEREVFQPGLFDELEVEETEEDLLFRDFRRALKARAMRVRMPIQLGTDHLFVDTRTNQDPATRAWNSNVALYYKAGGIPWRLKIDGPETCFVGVSFHHLKTTKRHLVHSSIAQAFSTKGEGFALRGESVPWDEQQGRNVHLTEAQAFSLGQDILEEYQNRTGGAPLRMVLHKTSEFSEAERSGFRGAFKDIPVVELINFMRTDFRLVRFGVYPPNRGTLCRVNETTVYLFTSGFMPEIRTYPGPHIPAPSRLISDAPVAFERVAADILGLTRMNWNTADIRTSQPVTIFFARKIGGIMAEYGESPGLLSSFRYYI